MCFWTWSCDSLHGESILVRILAKSGALRHARRITILTLSNREPKVPLGSRTRFLGDAQGMYSRCMCCSYFRSTLAVYAQDTLQALRVSARTVFVRATLVMYAHVVAYCFFRAILVMYARCADGRSNHDKSFAIEIKSIDRFNDSIISGRCQRYAG